MANVLHKVLNNKDLHEVKGADTAQKGHILVANGKGQTSFMNISDVMNIDSGDGSGSTEGDSTVNYGTYKVRTIRWTSRVAETIDLSASFKGIYQVSGWLDVSNMGDKVGKIESLNYGARAVVLGDAGVGYFQVATNPAGRLRVTIFPVIKSYITLGNAYYDGSIGSWIRSFPSMSGTVLQGGVMACGLGLTGEALIKEDFFTLTGAGTLPETYFSSAAVGRMKTLTVRDASWNATAYMGGKDKYWVGEMRNRILALPDPTFTVKIWGF